MKIKNSLVISLFLIGSIAFTGLNADAQSLSKKEKKALKKELRQYKKHPETYKKMMDGKNETIASQEKTIEELNKTLAGLRKENAAIMDSLEALNLKYNNLIAKSINDPRKLPEGKVYQVQVGYYKNIDFESFNSTVRAVKAEQTADAERYVIGYFESLADAKAFAEDLRILGIKDAFVSQYINGIRNMDFDAYR